MVNDINTWRVKQTESLMSDLVASVTCKDPNFETLAHKVGLDPRVQQWVDSIHPRLRETAIHMINQETIEDCLIPHAQEILESEWMRHESDIKAKLHTKSEAYVAQLSAKAKAYFEIKKALLDEADAQLHKFETELNTKTADERQHLKNKSKATIQLAKDEDDSQMLSLAIHTPKATKPSPLNISKLKKKKKKVTILDLTTVMPQQAYSLLLVFSTLLILKR